MKNAADLNIMLNANLEAFGLSVFGWFVMSEAPFEGKKAALIGNHAINGEHVMWQVLLKSPEFADGQPDPMNRWTERVVGAVANTIGATAIFPFGEKLWPFQRYAKAATGMKNSPLGVLIHPEFGLWQAFRAVLVFDTSVVLPVPETLTHPCDDCADKPCLAACPVNAFKESGLNVKACHDHLESGHDPDCMNLGCRARAACPFGIPYSAEQIRFHMQSFKG